LREDGWDNLYATATNANYGYALAFKIDFVVVVGGVAQFALEVR